MADFPGRLPKEQSFPEPQFNMPYDDSWPRKQSKWRKKQQSSTIGHNRDLERLTIDDEPDTYFWRQPEPPEDQSEFWTSLCEGVARTGVRKMDDDITWLDSWNKMDGMVCHDGDMQEGVFKTEADAVGACGGTCAAVVDVGCARTEFRLCTVGYGTEPSIDGSCTRAKPPNFIPRDGMPRGAREDALWQEFCGQGNFVQFKLAFKQRTCPAAQNVVRPADLPPAQTEAACAELVVADASCSDVFDFAPSEDETKTQCRCTPKGQECTPTKAEAGQTIAIYIIEKVHGAVLAPAPAEA